MRAEAGVSDLCTAGLPTLAVRVPQHPLALALLRAFGGPVAGPSANPSGTVSPTTAGHVLDGLGGRIAAVLDGGACPVGLESTIVGVAGDAPALLRPGGLPSEAIEAALGKPLAAATAGITAPGQLASHYAPAARLRLNAAAPRPGELWLGFGPDAGAGAGAGSGSGFNLSPIGDLHEAAANLFAHLRALDARAAPGQTIAVAPIPRTGLGRAIHDRLARAAAPRG
jgi:L-threonylcarbamoyladenylate synthase